MTLPASGPIDLQMIGVEFGGLPPYSLSQYYRGGGLVPNSAQNAAVPTSGPISLADFYNASSTVSSALTLTAASGNGGLVAGYSDGTYEAGAFGSLVPAIWNGIAVKLIAGVNNIAPFSFEFALAGVWPQNKITVISFSDHNANFRQFFSNAVSSFSPAGGNSVWLWPAGIAYRPLDIGDVRSINISGV